MTSEVGQLAAYLEGLIRRRGGVASLGEAASWARVSDDAARLALDRLVADGRADRVGRFYYHLREAA